MRGILIFLAIVAALGVLGWRSGDVPPVDEVAAAQAETDVALQSMIVDGAGGVPLHVVFAGPADGAPVILIHGFPEFWYAWREQITVLADAGYRVAALDLRGYNRSGKPKGRDAYGLSDYAADIVALMDGQGWSDAYVAGHDIGAAVTWTLSYDHPERVRKAVAFNVAPLGAIAEATADGAKSDGLYRIFFRAPFLPELALRAGRYFVLGRLLEKSGAFDAAVLERYKAAWARDNAISTMLGFYRADGLGAAVNRQGPDVPAFLVLAENDPYLPKAAVAPARRYLGAENVVVWPGVSHWTLQEKPSETASVMIEWFQQK